MKVKIDKIVSIYSGIYAKTHAEGDVFYLLARDFDQYRQLKTNLEPGIFLNKSIQKHFLKKGDIIFASKGFDNFAYVYNEEFKPAVASSMFLILRNPDNNSVLPEYLAWFLNHPTSHKYFRSMAKGTNLPSISKQSLGNLEIHLPNLEKQKLIVRVSYLYKKQLQLKDNIRELKDKLISQKLFNTIKE